MDIPEGGLDKLSERSSEIRIHFLRDRVIEGGSRVLLRVYFGPKSPGGSRVECFGPSIPYLSNRLEFPAFLFLDNLGEVGKTDLVIDPVIRIPDQGSFHPFVDFLIISGVSGFVNVVEDVVLEIADRLGSQRRVVLRRG